MHINLFNIFAISISLSDIHIGLFGFWMDFRLIWAIHATLFTLSYILWLKLKPFAFNFKTRCLLWFIGLPHFYLLCLNMSKFSEDGPLPLVVGIITSILGFHFLFNYLFGLFTSDDGFENLTGFGSSGTQWVSTYQSYDKDSAGHIVLQGYLVHFVCGQLINFCSYLIG